MKKHKRTLALLLSLLFCLAAFSPAALAAGDADAAVDETPMPRNMLRIAVELASNFVSARGNSNYPYEYLTIQFWLYDDMGIYITSGSGSGYFEAYASKSVSLDTGTYRLVATVTGTVSGSKTHAFYLDV